ncbi:MAG TPA: hypothetical protein VGD99_17625, partial [Anaerolineae bacterium]
MTFAQRKPLPRPEAGQTLFSGREKEIGLYRLHFDRPQDHPQVRLITVISGSGGVGKTRLLDELEWFRPAETIYGRLDSRSGLGHDATRLLRVLADSLHREGEPIPTPNFDRLFKQRQTLLEKALTRSRDPKQVRRHFYRPILLGLDPAPSPFSPDLDLFADLNWSEAELNLAFQNPIGLLTQALVVDLNQGGEGSKKSGEESPKSNQERDRKSDTQPQQPIDGKEKPAAPKTVPHQISDRGSVGEPVKVVLMFDSFDQDTAIAGEWLLTYLLGQARERITCDLRLIIAGREALLDTDERWQPWQDTMLLLPLEPFTPAEVADFVRKNTHFSDPADIKRISKVTESSPLWLNVWAVSEASPTVTDLTGVF